MKSKKIVALVMSAAMVIGSASMLAACKPKDPGSNPGNFVPDDEIYHCAGTSAGEDAALYNQGWTAGEAGATEKVTFVKDTTKENENVFTLEMKMYAGDQFKVVKGTTAWSWSLTVSAFVGAEEDDTYSYVVKNDEDQVVFRGQDDGNGGYNICLNEGMDGIYEFTLKTNPGATEFTDQYQISYKLKQKTDKLRIPYDMEYWGDMNNFGAGAVRGLTKNADGTWSTVITVAEKDLKRYSNGKEDAEDAPEGETDKAYAAVYIVNVGDGKVDGEEKLFYDESAGIAHATISVYLEDVVVNLLPLGQYSVTFDPEKGEVSITEIKDDWNVVIGETEYKLDPEALTATFTLEEAATGIKLLNKYDNTEVTVGDLAAGTWVVKYDPETQTVKYDTKNNYYLVGTYTGDSDWASSVTNGHALKLTKNSETGLWEVTVDWTDKTDEFILFKVIVNANSIEGGGEWKGHWWENQHPDTHDQSDRDDDGNFKVAPGKYLITVDDNNYQKIEYTLITE